VDQHLTRDQLNYVIETVAAFFKRGL
jgi:hypothetical protein